MEHKRKCTDCGTPLGTTDAQPVCPACIFRRLSNIGSTVQPAESANTTPRTTTVREGDSDTDFYAEYELLGEIGRGGMGVIYKAHQPGLNRTVALKAIHAAGLAGDAARRRFQAEVKMAGRLNHPNIVPVFDVGVMDGCPCFSMEFFPGGSLADRLRQSGIRIEDGVTLLTKVARAVYFAHLGILDVATGKPAVALEVPDIKRFIDVAWLDGGKHLAGLVTTHAPRSTPGSVEQIVLWDTATGRIVRSVTNASITTVACAAPDGRGFVEAGADRNVRLRDAATLEVLREFRVHNAPITALAWHPTRPVLATASEDLVIRLWNLDDGKRLE